MGPGVGACAKGVDIKTQYPTTFLSSYEAERNPTLWPRPEVVAKMSAQTAFGALSCRGWLANGALDEIAAIGAEDCAMTDTTKIFAVAPMMDWIDSS